MFTITSHLDIYSVCEDSQISAKIISVGKIRNKCQITGSWQYTEDIWICRKNPFLS